MHINKESVAQQISAYLHHDLTQTELVNWAENALMEGDFVDADIEVLKEIIPRLGASDVRTFGLTWEDYEQMLCLLGYQAHVQIEAISPV